MNKVLKKALGFAGALGLTAVMVLAAAPVQASDVDTRIQVLERELVQLKQNQESALAAEMKAPSFKYRPGGGLTIAAADNNWSVTLKQRLQVYHTLWLSNENPEAGYQNLETRIRRFRPVIDVSSQQGFYKVTWLLNNGSDASTFGGDGFINFDKLNPWLPSFGWGASPGLSVHSQAGAFRTEDSPLLDGLGMSGGQDGSFVLSWKKLPGMGISKITNLQVAWGQDNQDEWKQGQDGNNVGFALGLKPLAKAKGMGGLAVSGLSYSFGYQAHTDTSSGVQARTPNLANRPNLINIDAVNADTTYMAHGLGWSPLKWLSLSANYATYERNPGGGVDVEASDIRLAAQVWLWGPKSGMMGGSKSEGGVSVAPLYSAADIDYAGGNSDVTNAGVAVVYNVPGGWMQIHGVWDTFGCEGDCPGATFAAVAEEGDDSFNTFTFVIEYKF